MATFRKRANRWQVQVRRRGFPPRSKTFDQRRDAERWATLQERDYDLLESRGEVASVALDATVGQLLARYRTTVVSKKRCAYSETYLVAALERRDIASFSVRSLKPDHVVGYAIISSLLTGMIKMPSKPASRSCNVCPRTSALKP